MPHIISSHLNLELDQTQYKDMYIFLVHAGEYLIFAACVMYSLVHQKSGPLLEQLQSLCSMLLDFNIFVSVAFYSDDTSMKLHVTW